jgi:hypothetical protein
LQEIHEGRTNNPWWSSVAKFIVHQPCNHPHKQTKYRILRQCSSNCRYVTQIHSPYTSQRYPTQTGAWCFQVQVQWSQEHPDTPNVTDKKEEKIFGITTHFTVCWMRQIQIVLGQDVWMEIDGAWGTKSLQRQCSRGDEGLNMRINIMTWSYDVIVIWSLVIVDALLVHVKTQKYIMVRLVCRWKFERFIFT